MNNMNTITITKESEEVFTAYIYGTWIYTGTYEKCLEELSYLKNYLNNYKK